MSTAQPDGPDWAAARTRVVRDATGIAVAVGTYGISYGALGVASGLSVVQTCALSVLAFTGASTFALLGVLGSGGSALAATAAALLLGTRNAMYGLHLSPLIRVRGVRRVAAAHLVLDESTAMALGQDPGAFGRRAVRLAFWSTGLFVFVVWNIATLLGAVGATAFGDPRALGLDAAAGAAFLALLWPRLRQRVAWVVAIAGAAVALALTPFVTPGIPVLAAGLVAVVVGVVEPGEGAVAEAEDAVRTDGVP